MSRKPSANYIIDQRETRLMPGWRPERKANNDFTIKGRGNFFNWWSTIVTQHLEVKVRKYTKKYFVTSKSNSQKCTSLQVDFKINYLRNVAK